MMTDVTEDVAGRAFPPAGAAAAIGPKTVTVFLDASACGEKRAARAAALARRWGAHLVGVHMVFANTRLHPSMLYARGVVAIERAIDHQEQLDADAEAAAAVLGGRFRALCGRWDISGEFRPIGRGRTAEEAICNSLHSDLAIVGHPEPHGLPEDVSPKRILRASGVPVLIVPNAWNGPTIGEKILIGWNASREARRAVSDAMGFLVAAKSVTVLVIDSASHRWHGEEPGADIALDLARHGAHVNVDRVSSNGSPVGMVIRNHALASGSDLLVVGAYSHVRLRELMVGGVTQTLLGHMPIPVLISR